MVDARPDDEAPAGTRPDIQEPPAGGALPTVARTGAGGMSRIPRMLGGMAEEFGGLLVFWIALWSLGLRAAIAATLLFVLLDGTRRLVRRRPVTRIWILSNGLALGCSVVDLSASTPFLIRYEAVGTNLLTALVFGLGAFGAKSMVQEIAEGWQGAPFEDGRPDLRAFFRAFTLVWAGYFLAKALVYLWLAAQLPLERALALRSLIGTVSFVLTIPLSRRGAALFRLARRFGLFAMSGAPCYAPGRAPGGPGGRRRGRPDPVLRAAGQSFRTATSSSATSTLRSGQS